MDIDENAAPKIQKYRSNRKSGIILKRTECFCRWSRKIGGALWRDNPLTAPGVMSAAEGEALSGLPRRMDQVPECRANDY